MRTVADKLPLKKDVSLSVEKSFIRALVVSVRVNTCVCAGGVGWRPVRSREEIIEEAESHLQVP